MSFFPIKLSFVYDLFSLVMHNREHSTVYKYYWQLTQIETTDSQLEIQYYEIENIVLKITIEIPVCTPDYMFFTRIYLDREKLFL